jgi:hypothetical protein
MTQAVTQANPESKLSQFLIALCEFMIGTALGYREQQEFQVSLSMMQQP